MSMVQATVEAVGVEANQPPSVDANQDQPSAKQIGTPRSDTSLRQTERVQRSNSLRGVHRV